MSLEAFRKKSFAYRRMFTIVFVGLMFAATLHIQIAHASPLIINVWPVSAPVGSTITVSGVDASRNGEVRIYVVGFVFVASAQANATGGYSVDIAAPAVPSGTYDIMALDVETEDTASTTFSIRPRIVLTPTEGWYNKRVSVKGDGFQSGSNMTLTFGGIDVTPSPSPQTDFLGSFEASFYVPSTPNGTYNVTASDTWGTTASASFNVVPKITVWPTSSAPSNVAFVNGYGFASSVNVTMAFGSIDVTPYPWLATGFDGSFGIPFFIPDVENGLWTINASDVNENWATAPFAVPTPILALTPERTFDSTIVTAKGTGFQPYTPILLYLEDVSMTSLVDLMWMSQDLMPDEYGSFEYSFIVPVTKPGVYTVVAYTMPGPPPTELERLTSASLTIADNTPIDMEVNVGSMHFRGEIAEFYVKTSFGGKLVDATIDRATLYCSNGTSSLDLTSGVVHVATGLYRIPYAVPSDAAVGTYTLLVEGSYTTSLIEAFGTSSGNFVLSPTLTTQNTQLINIENKIGTVIIPELGTIKTNLTAINARLVSVEGRTATIQSDIGVLTTDFDTINAKITSIQGNTATITSDLGTVTRDLGATKSEVTTGIQVATAALILSFIAAFGAMILLVLLRKMLPATPR